MSNRLGDLLEIWRLRRVETDWVLGTVYRTESSAYRKAGERIAAIDLDSTQDLERFTSGLSRPRAATGDW